MFNFYIYIYFLHFIGKKISCYSVGMEVREKPTRFGSLFSPQLVLGIEFR